ncbi:MAG: hypothetical protein HYY23_21825 [Verrucomicrobia bacterium]|nr:hypothetical protein [Verrucomicrobiota bacterium]
MARTGAVRLYRGLSKQFNPNEVGERQQSGMTGTNFTDCPYAALLYARGTKGTVLVLDVTPEELARARPRGIRVTKELWSLDGSGPRRYMIWGRFEGILTAGIPATKLRAEIRRKGVRAQPGEVKSRILKRFIEDYIHD